jgi:hypothetical protein
MAKISVFSIHRGMMVEPPMITLLSHATKSLLANKPLQQTKPRCIL